ncbi:MAG: 23S rRNA (guanosine(2251)-2'-O)-methyltransferase RlmB [Flavobacteriales bacterium]|nr:23S rRNA (guanosine(2251)-2'-O)-methyltransferase RlmB [Flavobacteriales bacterium]MCB9175418.1 23S rRNA (guanosine(2251)-2'-O)-methyltransferase RlmB [Flavobacteriales bacterium]
MKEKENIIFGIHPVIEAIKSGKEIEKVYIQQDIQGQGLTELRNVIKKSKVPFSHVPVQRLNKYTQGAHQGVLCFISPIETQDIEDVLARVFEEGKVPLVLILDRVTDVRNFGAITRTAECLGVQAIIIPKRESAQINEDAIKTSTGAIFRMPICKVDNLTDTLFLLKDSGLNIVSCTEKTDRLISEVDFNQPTAIIMGNEEKGIANQLLKNSNDLAKIPMVGEIASLNVSVAAGMVIYEASKQRLDS